MTFKHLFGVYWEVGGQPPLSCGISGPDLAASTLNRLSCLRAFSPFLNRQRRQKTRASRACFSLSPASPPHLGNCNDTFHSWNLFRCTRLLRVKGASVTDLYPFSRIHLLAVLTSPTPTHPGNNALSHVTELRLTHFVISVGFFLQWE